MTNETGENFMYYKSAKKIWDVAKETYSNKDNTSEVFEMEGTFHDLRQNELSVIEYFNFLNKLWQQLDICEELEWKCLEDNQQYKKVVEKKQIYKFLLSLNKNLDEVRGRILSTKPLSSIREAFQMCEEKKARRR